LNSCSPRNGAKKLPDRLKRFNIDQRELIDEKPIAILIIDCANQSQLNGGVITESGRWIFKIMIRRSEAQSYQ